MSPLEERIESVVQENLKLKDRLLKLSFILIDLETKLREFDHGTI